MGLPDPALFDDSEAEPTRPTPAEPPAPSAAPMPPSGAEPEERPDWLVGAEEGAQSEFHRSEDAPSGVRLTRPQLPTAAASDGITTGLEAPTAAPTGPRPTLVRPGDGALPGLPLASRAAAAEKKSDKPIAWQGAGDSVPRLSVVAEKVVEDDDEAESPLDGDTGGFGGPALIGADEARRTPIAAPRPLVEPWWIVAAEAVSTDRKLQIFVAGGLAFLITLWIVWPRGSESVSVRKIRQHAEAWEGREVRVTGRVGEVFALGQGVVYNLHQGRDTIVVFSRSRRPSSRDRVSVSGTVSTGYLDGSARVSILENTQ
ncbi:MAG: hypothetical protein HOP12_08570 [Candidatus Eisenbacteria bacterium]|uniref:Uncharacterized protein n=1 Tax=Eiseniibacteriota bacterium TaxID=2212470 RepID=A0A849SI00_UNCEI|nr:hypothetical protein [Candidatus Eisenbacteria bacterium]